MHYFSEKQRVEQLRSLIGSINLLIPALQESKQYVDSIETLQEAALEANRLLVEGFVQDDLSNLSRSVPRLFWLHKEWCPPLEADGLSEPLWFKTLAPLEAKVTEASERLRVIGEY